MQRKILHSGICAVLVFLLQVVGWGVENGVEFWHVRNSWGTYWGEQGFARVMMHKNNLALERDCDWGVPLLQKPNLVQSSPPQVSMPKQSPHGYNGPCVRKTQVCWHSYRDNGGIKVVCSVC